MKFIPAQSGIFGFDVIQRVSAELVKAERVGAGPPGYGGLYSDEWFFRIEEKSFCINSRFCFNSLYKEDYYA